MAPFPPPPPPLLPFLMIFKRSLRLRCPISANIRKVWLFMFLFIKFDSYSYQFKLDMTNHKYDVKNLDTGYHRILKCENSNDVFIDLLMWIWTGERGSLSLSHPPPTHPPSTFIDVKRYENKYWLISNRYITRWWFWWANWRGCDVRFDGWNPRSSNNAFVTNGPVHLRNVIYEMDWIGLDWIVSPIQGMITLGGHRFVAWYGHFSLLMKYWWFSGSFDKCHFVHGRLSNIGHSFAFVFQIS